MKPVTNFRKIRESVISILDKNIEVAVGGSETEPVLVLDHSLRGKVLVLHVDFHNEQIRIEVVDPGDGLYGRLIHTTPLTHHSLRTMQAFLCYIEGVVEQLARNGLWK